MSAVSKQQHVAICDTLQNESNMVNWKYGCKAIRIENVMIFIDRMEDATKWSLK